MKHLRRTLSLLLCFAMVIGSLSVTSLAADGTAVTTEAELVTAFTNGGTYYLANDITLTSSYAPPTNPKTFTLDMNGCNITADSTFNSRLLQTAAYSGRTFTFKNSKTTGGKITGIPTASKLGSLFYVQLGTLELLQNVTIDNCGRKGNTLISFGYNSTYSKTVTLQCTIQNCNVSSIIATNANMTKDAAITVNVKSGAKILNNTITGDAAIIFNQTATSTYTKAFTYNQSAGYVQSVKFGDDARVKANVTGGYVGKVTMGTSTASGITGGHYGVGSTVLTKSGYIYVNPTVKDAEELYPCDVVASASTFSVKYYDGSTELTELGNAAATCAGVAVPNFEKAGDTLLSWNTDPNGNGQKVEVGTDLYGLKDQSINLYAQWQSSQKAYVHYFDDETEYEGIKTACEFNTQATIAPGETKDGFYFKEWNTQADGLGTSYAPGDKLDVADTSVNLYAVWYEADDVVAEVTPRESFTTYYTDIETAINAAIEASTDSTGKDAGTTGTDVTIKLLKDVKVPQMTLRKSTSASYDTVTRTITFDLNNHIYKCTAGSTKPAFIANKNTTVEIGGGTFIAGYICNGNSGSKYTLRDGYYYALSDIKYGTATAITITGGKFVKDPSARLTSSYSVDLINEEHNGYVFGYEVVKQKAVISVDGVKYNNIDTAIDNIKNDSEVKLIDDCTLTDIIKIEDKEAEVIFDLGGHTLTAAEGKQLFNVTAGNVSIKNGTLKTGTSLVGTGHIYVKNADLNLNDVTIDSSAIIDNSKVIYSEGYVFVNNVLTTTGDVYQAASVARFTNAALDLSTDLTLKYTAQVAVGVFDEEKSIVLEASYGETAQAIQLHGNGEYEFPLILTTAQMGNEVVSTIKIDDKTISDEFKYSVLQYSKDVEKEYSDNSDILTLIANTLALGQQVKKYWKYSDGVSFDIPEELAGYVTSVAVPSTVNVKKTTSSRTTNENKIVNASLNVSDKFAISLYVLAEEGNILEISVGDKTYKPIVMKKTYTTSSLYHIVLDFMSPTEYNKVMNATLKTPSGDVLHAVSYSVNSYFYVMQASSEVGNLCKAAYSYGRSANNYVYHVVYAEPTYTWNADYSKCTATMVYEDAPTVTETVNTTRTVTTPASAGTKEVCTYTATFTNKLFTTQTQAGVETQLVGIETNVDESSVYLPTIKLSNQVKYREVYTGGAKGEWETLVDADFKNVSFDEGVLKADIDVTIHSKELDAKVELPIAEKVSIADALNKEDGSKFLISGVVAETKTSDFRKDIVLYDAQSGKSADIVIFTNDDIVSNFTVGDKVLLPVECKGDALIYNGDLEFVNYIESSENDITGYTSTIADPTITKVEVTKMPYKTTYDYKCPIEDLALRGGEITLTYSDGTTVTEAITKDMLSIDTSGATELGKMKYKVEVDGVSDSIVLNYSYVSVDGFNNLELGATTELHAIVVATSVNFAGDISLSNGEIIVRDVDTNTLLGIAGLNTTTAAPFAEFAVGDEIVVSVTKNQYGTSNSNDEKEYAKALSVTSFEIISHGNSAVVDKSSAIEISSQEEFKEFLGENGSRKDSFYKLVKLDAGVKFGRYGSTSSSSYIYFNETTSLSNIKVDGMAPYVVQTNMNYNVGSSINDLIFDGNQKTFSSGGSTSTKDVYMVFIGGVGAYYHQFILIDSSYIGEENAFVKGELTKPYKTQYLLGEELDFSGGKITETYTSKYYNKTVAIDNADVVIKSNNFNKDAEGTYEIVLTYNDRDYSFEVEVVDKTVKAIELLSGLSSAVGHRDNLDTIDYSGATINVTYGDDSTSAMAINRSMLPILSDIEMGTHDYTVTYGGKTAALSITKEIEAISVSEFKDKTSGTYEVRGVIVGPASTTDTTELMIMDPDTYEVVGIYNTGIIDKKDDNKFLLDETVCKVGDEVVATLKAAHYTTTGSVNTGKYYADAKDFKDTCIVISSGNNSTPDATKADAITISSQEELRDFLLNNNDRFYSFVKLVDVKGVSYSGSLRIFFGEDVTSYSEQQVDYENTTYCSPLLSNKNQSTYVSNWKTYFENVDSTDYESPATCGKAIYALYLGGNVYYEHFVILDESYFTDDKSTGESKIPDLQEVNIHTSDKGEAPALQCILNADGSFGGTLNLNKYGEGAPLNGELDHLDSVYYTYNDYYNIKCTDTRTLIPHFATYQQTMADSDGIACALMLFNHYGEDVSGEFSEENLVKAYEEINETTVYGNGTTAEGLVALFESKGYEAKVDTALAGAGDLSGYLQSSLKAGRVPVIYYHQEMKERFVAVIGYDNMGTPATGDDVVILANPFDAYDHYQDGYQMTKYGYLNTWMCSVDQAGNTSRKYECFTVTPKTAETFEYSEVDELITNPSIGERHLLANIDGTISGNYKTELYGGGSRCNGYYRDGGYQYSCEHFTYNYYAYPDIFNMTNTESRAVLTGFASFQQTMASSCGISSTLNTLNYLGYDFTQLADYIDDPEFETLLPNDYAKIQEAIVKIYMTGDDTFINNPDRKFNNYGGVGASNLSKVPLKIGYYDSEFGRYFRSNINNGVYTPEETMPFPTYESFLAFVKEQIYAGQPIIFCGPNHWRVITGIDDMGTESPYDDIIFLGDSSDAWDHYIDGVDTEVAVSFYARWYNGGRSTNQQYILIKGNY